MGSTPRYSTVCLKDVNCHAPPNGSRQFVEQRHSNIRENPRQMSDSPSYNRYVQSEESRYYTTANESGEPTGNTTCSPATNRLSYQNYPFLQNFKFEREHIRSQLKFFDEKCT